MPWEAMTIPAIQAAVLDALGHNLSYERGPLLGLPGSTLDRRVFPRLHELKDFALLRTFVANPNHIGCHTLGSSESVFEGTQAIERDLLRLCAEQLLRAAPDSYDGYVASGGTEANIQALWTYRNRFRDLHGAHPGSCGVLCSEDTHYSIAKGSDLLGLSLWQVPVDPYTRVMDPAEIERVARRMIEAGVTHVIVVLNMGTTMFGSIDDPDPVLLVLDTLDVAYSTHVDGAFGGFIYPLLAADNRLDFLDPRITSITLDAHKMLQAPYGTGIHLIRKGYMQHVYTKSAQYVPGLDCTLVGSRSGTNAVAAWMILQSYGSEGGAAFCRELVDRAARLCDTLTELGVRHYRHLDMNVVTMRAQDIPDGITHRWHLVPDTHDGDPQWVKIVVMEHVDDAALDRFVDELGRARANTSP